MDSQVEMAGKDIHEHDKNMDEDSANAEPFKVQRQSYRLLKTFSIYMSCISLVSESVYISCMLISGTCQYSYQL